MLKPRPATPKTRIIVLIDQLRADDAKRFPELSTLAQSCGQTKVSYLPTLTETAHACVAVGATPSSHGIIGDSWYRRHADGEVRRIELKSFLETESHQYGPTKMHELSGAGWQCYVVAGKSKVANLIDPPWVGGRAAIRVTLERRPGQAEFAIDAWMPNGTRMTGGPDAIPAVPSLESPRSDEVLFAWSDFLLDSVRDSSRNAILLLALHRLDTLGHRHSRDSSTFNDACSLIDQRLAQFLRSHEPDSWLVTSDHGFRDVDRMIVPYKWQLQVWPANPSGTTAPLRVVDIPHELLVEHNNGSPAMIMDGGTARFWAGEGQSCRLVELLDRELGELCWKVAEPVDVCSVDGCDPKSLVHRNWGDVVAVAARNVAFCKPEWVAWRADRPTVAISAEHGTPHQEDRSIPWWGVEPIHTNLLTES